MLGGELCRLLEMTSDWSARDAIDNSQRCGRTYYKINLQIFKSC